MARAVLGVAVQRQVRQHEPEAVAELLDERLPLAVREPGGVQQGERRTGARLAVGDPRPVVVVVEAELHGAPPIVESPAVLRSPYDREILRLAVPALGALAAEPLYVLVDTAIVGHLGTPQLASLAIAATVLSTAFTIFNFLTYGTTAQVARLHGAGREARGRRARRAGAVAVADHRRSCWSGWSPRLARPLASLMGAEGEVLDGAVTYLRIAALGAPFFMLASAGQGYLRGVGDLATPLKILVAAHVVNVVLELLFVYGFDWGLAGSAWGTVIAQAGHGRGVLRRPAPRRLGAAGARRGCGRSCASATRSPCARPRCSARSSSPPACSRGSARRRSARTRSRSSCSCSSRSCSTRSRSPRR